MVWTSLLPLGRLTGALRSISSLTLSGSGRLLGTPTPQGATSSLWWQKAVCGIVRVATRYVSLSAALGLSVMPQPGALLTSVPNQALSQSQQEITIVLHQELIAVHPEGGVHQGPDLVACSDLESSAKTPGSPGAHPGAHTGQMKVSGKGESRWAVSACMVQILCSNQLLTQRQSSRAEPHSPMVMLGITTEAIVIVTGVGSGKPSGRALQ